MAISWIIDLFKGAEDKGPVGLLYKDIVAQARAVSFYKDLNVSDDVDGRFDMIAIHMFLAMNRMRQDATLEKLSQKLANLIISDMDRSLREMGVGDLGVGRRVQTMGKALYGRFEMYDLALNTESGAQTKLADVVMRNVFRSEEGANHEANRIAEYIVKQTEALKEVNSAAISAGHIEFKDVKDLIDV